MGGADSSGSVRHRGSPWAEEKMRRTESRGNLDTQREYGIGHGEMDYGTDKWPARLLYSKGSVDTSVAA